MVLPARRLSRVGRFAIELHAVFVKRGIEVGMCGQAKIGIRVEEDRQSLRTGGVSGLRR